jgi:Tfp pilus assembly protein PilX
VRKKGVVLAIVIGVLVVIFTLALVAMYVMTQEARIAERKIRRMRGTFAARAGMVHALEEIRLGRGAALNGSTIQIGAGEEGYPTGGVDVTFDYDSTDTSGPMGTSPVHITVTNY